MNNNIITCDITNKVVLSLDEFLKINDELKLLRQKNIDKDSKYDALINYLLSECELVNYTNTEKGLQYDRYDNHLAEYLMKIEPDRYEEHLEYLINKGEKN